MATTTHKANVRRLTSLQLRTRIDNKLNLTVPGKFAYMCDDATEATEAIKDGFFEDLVKDGTLIPVADRLLLCSGTEAVPVIVEYKVTAAGGLAVLA